MGLSNPIILLKGVEPSSQRNKKQNKLLHGDDMIGYEVKAAVTSVSCKISLALITVVFVRSQPFG